MNRTILIVFLAILPGTLSAKTVEIGERVSFTFDEDAWQVLHPRTPGGEALKIQHQIGDFTVVVVPEEKIVGGISTPETRAGFIKGLSKSAVKTEDVKQVRVFNHDGYEFVGTRTIDDTRIKLRIVLIKISSDVIFVITSSVDEDPLQRPEISAVWKSVVIR